MDWTEEADAKVLALLAEGLTRGAIAERMGVTRNAICGKVHRLLKCARSSTVEPAAHNGEVAGSIPAGHTTIAPLAPESDSEYVWPTLGKWQDMTPVAPQVEIIDETALDEIALAMIEALPAVEEEPEFVAEPPTAAPADPLPVIQRYAAPKGMHRIIVVDDADGREYVMGDFSAESRSAMYRMQRIIRGTTRHVYDDEGFWIASCGNGPSRSHQIKPREKWQS